MMLQTRLGVTTLGGWQEIEDSGWRNARIVDPRGLSHPIPSLSHLNVYNGEENCRDIVLPDFTQHFPKSSL